MVLFLAYGLVIFLLAVILRRMLERKEEQSPRQIELLTVFVVLIFSFSGFLLAASNLSWVICLGIQALVACFAFVVVSHIMGLI